MCGTAIRQHIVNSPANSQADERAPGRVGSAGASDAPKTLIRKAAEKPSLLLSVVRPLEEPLDPGGGITVAALPVGD